MRVRARPSLYNKKETENAAHMLRLSQLLLPLDEAQDFDEQALRRLCAQRLKLPEHKLGRVRLIKRSVDARDKQSVRFALTADVTLSGGDAQAEKRVAARFKPNQVTVVAGQMERRPPDVWSLALPPWPTDAARPLVVGAGPAGLFCALALAVRGAKPLLIERGKPVDRRAQDVETLEAAGQLDANSNVLFGEGGAGAFSDGKLTCGLSDPHIRTVLGTLVRCGAPEDILISQRPHVGTDELRGVLKRLRAALLRLGAEVRFETTLRGLTVRDGRVAAAQLLVPQGEDEFVTDTVCLAIGHSARDTLLWLHEAGVMMQPKPFSMGVRIEHRQAAIDLAQYGACAGHPALPPAEYKLNVPTPDGRGVYTFCMCPGGQVINASSEPDGVNVNGMSLHARAGANANAAVLVGVSPADFGSDHPLAGVALQRRVEQAAFALTGSLRAPCQRVEDFLQGRPSAHWGEVLPSYRPGVTPCDLADVLPPFVLGDLRLALPLLAQKLKGFDHPDALLTGPETRSSSPVRLLRGADRQSDLRGLYPLGEGAGYAGGIVSAAVDGLKAGMSIAAE